MGFEDKIAVLQVSRFYRIIGNFKFHDFDSICWRVIKTKCSYYRNFFSFLESFVVVYSKMSSLSIDLIA